MKSAQEFMHWLEVGAGARWIRRAAVLAAIVSLSLLVAWKQFHGPATEATLRQADVGRQLARGAGFTTQVNHPQTAAVLERRGVPFDPAQPYPELHHAPLYPLVIGGALRLLPGARREALFASAPTPPNGFGGDYFLLGLNLLLLWLAVWLVFDLGRRLFEPRVGTVAALGVLLSVSIWQEAVAVNGTPLLMVLGLLMFQAWHRVELAAASSVMRAPAWPLLALGTCAGGLFLADYAVGAVLIVVVGAVALRFSGSARLVAVGCVLAGAVAVSAPWLVRNVALTGNPVALAAQGVALKAGDPTAEPATTMATLSTEKPPLDLRKLANKVLTSLQENLQTRLWSGGAMWFAAFFFAGWLYAFRAPVANRMRWLATITFGVLLLAQATFNAGDAERHVVVWFAPIVIIFGAAFFFVLLGSNTWLAQWPRTTAGALLALQALPLLHDALEPRRLHFHYPPYFPALLQGLRHELDRRSALERFGIMADIPAGVAWYGGVRAWTQPPTLRDFYAITLQQPIGELLLTPRTLDRPFFTELSARPLLPGALGAVPNRFGEWGEVYAGLLTGAMPREFPLGAPQKLAENLFVLLNPALPPPRGK